MDCTKEVSTRGGFKYHPTSELTTLRPEYPIRMKVRLHGLSAESSHLSSDLAVRIG